MKIVSGAKFKATYHLLVVRIWCSILISVTALFSCNASSKIPTTTRLVKLFGDLENDLNTAISVRDSSKIDSLLGQEFEQRTGESPNDPIPRSEWISTSLGQYLIIKDFNITQMSVTALGDTNIVCFRLDYVAERKKSKIYNLFVVDVWIKEGIQWRLKSRYIDPVGPVEYPLLGTLKKVDSAQTKKVDKKTGADSK
jgi:hypothetical protein